MQQLFKAIHYTQLDQIEQNIPLFDWLTDFLSKHRISISIYNKYYCTTKWKLWHNLLTKETTSSIHPLIFIQPSSSSPKQEIQNTFKNTPSKEVLCTDSPSYNIRSESLDSESGLLDNSNLSQTTKDNFNKT